MNVFRQKTLKPVSFVLAIFMLLISGPFQSVYASMIGTETVLNSDCGQQARWQVCRSAAGCYVGTVCQCGPYTRESYYMKPDEARAAFDRWLTGDFVMARGNGV